MPSAGIYDTTRCYTINSGIKRGRDAERRNLWYSIDVALVRLWIGS